MCTIVLCESNEQTSEQLVTYQLLSLMHVILKSVWIFWNLHFLVVGFSDEARERKRLRLNVKGSVCYVMVSLSGWRSGQLLSLVMNNVVHMKTTPEKLVSVQVVFSLEQGSMWKICSLRPLWVLITTVSLSSFALEMYDSNIIQYSVTTECIILII